ncbi:MerR family transcriptional regulator [Actinomycetospora sp. CA-053990]|uniref:MerR family transcriptional regulator n=1 Tax=Actinomycetospora sp. CA-053990 TaxID=3239891 RepID=UPI003D8C5B4F
MAWSTRQLAELTGTTLRTVRHYHEVGLLEEPKRRANGYKQYGVAHLVRVLRIKRLTDLGLSLAEIAEMGDADEHPEAALRKLDAELAESIERLQRIRAELALILREAAPTDLPPEIAPAAARADLSDADRSYMVVLSRVLGPKGIKAYADLMSNYQHEPLMTEFDELSPEADEQTRQDLAERMLPHVRALRAEHPELRTADEDAPQGAKFAARTMGQAMIELYSPAQLDVLKRVGRLTLETPDEGA